MVIGVSATSERPATRARVAARAGRVGAAALLTAACLLVSSGAAGQPATPPAGAAEPAPLQGAEREALEHYQRGRRLLDEERPADALAAFDASLLLLPSANTELMKAHAVRSLGRRGEALALYLQVMGSAGARVRAGEERFRPTLAEAGRWAAILRAELGELTIDLSQAPADVTLTIDAVTVETTTDRASGTRRAHVWLEPRRVRVVAATPAGAQRTGTVDLEPGGARALTLDFGATASARETSSGPPIASVVAAGVGVVGLGAFAVFAVMAEAADEDLSHCSPRCFEPGDLDTERARDRYATAANVSLAVGAVAIVTGGVIWLVASRRASTPASAHQRRPSPELRVPPSGAAVRLTF